MNSRWTTAAVAAALCAAAAVSLSQKPASAAPDTILYNARIWTVDPAMPEAQAIAVRGDKIVRVGSDKQVLTLKGPHTQLTDLHGARVLPGFNDAHTHFENAVQWFFEARLVDVNTESQMLERLGEAAKRVPPGMWITAIDMSGMAGWDAEKKGDKSFKPLEPSLADVDAAAGDHPVLLKRYDGAAFLNTVGMKVIHLDPHASPPKGGKFGRDPRTGQLNGMLYGKAAGQVAAILPVPTMASKLIGARGVIRQMNAFGLTSIHDIARLNDVSQLQVYPTDIERSYTDVDIFRNLEKQHELNIRVYAFQPLRSWAQLAQFGIHPGSGDDFVRFGILKDFHDGGLMLEPYSNNPNFSGSVTYRFTSDAEERKVIDTADKAGFDIGIHTIGDRALQQVLDWYSEAVRVNGPRPGRRDRIIHMWYANPELIKKAGDMHLIADVTPWHLLSDPEGIEKEIGPVRSNYAFAWRSMIDAGMKLNIVSDMPGLYSRMDTSPYNPLENIYYAIMRRNAQGEPTGGWHPEQTITLKEAIEAYTINPAYSSHEEAIKGSLSPGKLADLVVLSQDILAVPPEALLKTRVEMTMVGGKVVYESH